MGSLMVAWQNSPSTATPITAENLAAAFAEPVADARLPVTAQAATLAATYAPLSGGLRRNNLRRFQSALGDGQITNLLHIGHSVTEGANVVSAGQRWTDLLLDAVRAVAQPPGVVGGWGYITARPVYTFTQRANWSFTGTIGQSTQGPTTVAANMPANATATLVFTGTAIRIHYTQYPSAPTVGVTIDGSAVASIVVAGADNYGKYQDFTGLTAGTHTIVLTNAAAGSFYFHGGLVMNGDTARGIRTFNAGYSGMYAAGFVSATSSPVAWAAIAPHLVTLEFETNEYRNNAGSAAYGTSLRALIDIVRTNILPNPSIVLFAGYEPLHGGTPSETYENYRAMTKTVAAEKRCQVIDLQQSFGTGVLPTTGLGSYDQIHPSASGHAAIADQLATLLLQDVTA